MSHLTPREKQTVAIVAAIFVSQRVRGFWWSESFIERQRDLALDAARELVGIVDEMGSGHDDDDD